MANSLNLYWGETHHNTYQQPVQEPDLRSLLQTAKGHLDFYAAAYYMASQNFLPLGEGVAEAEPEGPVKGHPTEQLARAGRRWNGVRFETQKPEDQLQKEWKEVQAATAAEYEPHRFVTFPGYEWQGDTEWGDHNVFYKQEGAPLFSGMTLPELYEALRDIEGFAIPHHTAYKPGSRAPRWEYHDESLSPFVEIYSIHGCSEYDGHPENLRANSHMGPGVGGATYEDLLNRGAHVGAIGSTDNWTDSPGRWGHGLMGCWAEELTRDGLWEAFARRCVYGVTGDRIELMMKANGAPMGSMLPAADTREIVIQGKARDQLDRIEILKNNRVVHVESYNREPEMPAAPTRHQLRLEMGWGPLAGEFPPSRKDWEGILTVEDGRFLGWSPCWVNTDQKPPSLESGRVEFKFCSYQMDTPHFYKGGYILEVEGGPQTRIRLQMNGRDDVLTLEDLYQSSQVISYEAEMTDLLLKSTGQEKAFWTRSNTPFIYSFKTRFQRLVSEPDYTFQVQWSDSSALEEETHYRARVFQRNGQIAWSSPIWFQ